MKAISRGGWAACAGCAELLDREKWGELIDRSVHEFGVKKFLFDLREIEYVRLELTRSHELFRRHRIV
jgi:hypothetical protein